MKLLVLFTFLVMPLALHAQTQRSQKIVPAVSISDTESIHKLLVSLIKKQQVSPSVISDEDVSVDSYRHTTCMLTKGSPGLVCRIGYKVMITGEEFMKTFTFELNQGNIVRLNSTVTYESN